MSILCDICIKRRGFVRPFFLKVYQINLNDYLCCLILQRSTIQYICAVHQVSWHTIYCLPYFPRTHLNITLPKSVQPYVVFHFLFLRLDKISANYEPPTVPKYMLPNTYITCIFVNPFFLFKGSYKNRLKDFLEKLIIQYFRPDEDDV